MNKQDQMTMQEAERKMESLREVFQVVRLVDGKMLMDREKRINAGDLSETCQCYSFWKKDKECENCSSLLALKEQTQKIKFEFLDLQVFQVISRYVEIDGRPYVMEMIQNLDESIQIDQEGYDKLISKLSGYNEKLYTDVLTGIYNRRFFEEKIKNMEDEAGIAVIDLDDFKLYNDIYGNIYCTNAISVNGRIVKISKIVNLYICYYAFSMLVRYHPEKWKTFCESSDIAIIRKLLINCRREMLVEVIQLLSGKEYAFTTVVISLISYGGMPAPIAP